MKKKNNAKAANSTTFQGATEQGALVDISKETGAWKNMQLATNKFIESDGRVAIKTLEFNNLGVKLRTTFQANQLFLVISSNIDNVLGDFNNKINIEDWLFSLNVSKPNSEEPHEGAYKNIIIFKYNRVSLIESVQNTNSWADPKSFNNTANNGLKTLSNWLKKYIQTGIDKALMGNGCYNNFYKIATDPNWTGFIALKVDVSSINLPAALNGLLAGINLNEFNAHHFGHHQSKIKRTSQVAPNTEEPDSFSGYSFDNFNANDLLLKQHSPKILEENYTLELEPASLFALIDYEDNTYKHYNSEIREYKAKAPINTSKDYVFKVLSLKVEFSNSYTTYFENYIALTVNKFFGDNVKPDNRNNLLILQGSWQKGNGVVYAPY